MNEIAQAQKNDFMLIYNRSYRLSAAIFVVSNIMDENEDLRTKIKNLSLRLVSVAVKLKDTSFVEAKKIISELEKNSLELMSMLDIASISGLVSKMNANILRDEFQSFISELNKFSEKFETGKDFSIKGVFDEFQVRQLNNNSGQLNTKIDNENNAINKNGAKEVWTDSVKNGNGYKRKDLRKNTILNFIKGHDNVGIKDILPNITGCSEKTVQRELINLVNERKIKKMGERRWSRYSII